MLSLPKRSWKKLDAQGVYPAFPVNKSSWCFIKSSQSECEGGCGRSSTGLLQRRNDCHHLSITCPSGSLPSSFWHFLQGPKAQNSWTLTALTRSKEKAVAVGGAGPWGLTGKLLSCQGHLRCPMLRFWRIKKSSISSGDVGSTFCSVSSALMIFCELLSHLINPHPEGSAKSNRVDTQLCFQAQARAPDSHWETSLPCDLELGLRVYAPICHLPWTKERSLGHLSIHLIHSPLGLH